MRELHHICPNADSIKHDHATEIKDFYTIVMLKSKKKVLLI